MENQDIDLIGQTVGNMPYKIGIVDQNGNLKNQFVANASTNRIDIPAQLLSGSGSTGGSTGGNTGGGDNPDHPSAGADYYAGSLADGEITERNLEWSGTDDPTKSTIIQFNDDPGLKPFGQYDGLMIIGYIQKTVMTKGVLGAVSNIYLNYDPNNQKKDGYFTTTSPYPIAIHASDLVAGKKNKIPINGIAENLNGKNIKAPALYLTYNSDRTAVLEHEVGYDNDGDSTGATGANYQFIVQYITTFSRQNAIAQLPAAVNFFNGNATGDIALTGVSKYYENSMDGMEITLDNYAYYHDERGSGAIGGIETAAMVRVDLTNLGLNKVRIPKEYLIAGTSFDYRNQFKIDDTNEIPVYYRADRFSDSYNWTTSATDGFHFKMSRLGNSILNIGTGSINVNFEFYIQLTNNTEQKTPAVANVIKITPYKD